MLQFALILTLSWFWRCKSETPRAVFPLQLMANIEITAHLIEEDSDYPPRTRRMTIFYDYINKRARADIEAGYEAAKLYIRRYDLDNEYMIRLPPIEDCKRSYLGENMPFPELPLAEFKKEEEIKGIDCNYFTHSEYNTKIHFYLDKSSGAPVRLIQEEIAN